MKDSTRVLCPTPLYPIGTPLSEIPDSYQGISWDEYQLMLWAECRKAVPADWATAMDKKPVSTPRDRYGWKGLPGISSLPSGETKPKRGRAANRAKGAE